LGVKLSLMWVLFCLCIEITIVTIIDYFVRKNHFGAIIYIWAGIYIALFFYLLRWSALISSEIHWMFIYIFVCFTVISVFYTYITKRMRPMPIENNEKIVMTKSGYFLVPFLTYTYIISYLIENYLGSGTFIPSLQHIDIHTYSAPIILYFTHSQFVVVAAAFYAFKASKKIKYIIYIILVLAIPVLTRYSRMDALIAAIRIISLLLFVESKNTGISLKEKMKKKFAKRIIIIALILAVVGMVALTNARMSHFGKYDIEYDSSIRFTGPKELSFFAPYYGYFPLSFENLNVNLSRNVTHNYIGIYSFTALYFGIFQIDNLLGIPVTGNIQGRIIASTSATVPTGFWDYYYDFDMLCFIPMIVTFVICYYILKKAKDEKRKLTFRTLYFWYIPTWFFMSFQNVMAAPINIVTAIFLIYVIKKSFNVVEEKVTE